MYFICSYAECAHYTALHTKNSTRSFLTLEVTMENTSGTKHEESHVVILQINTWHCQ